MAIVPKGIALSNELNEALGTIQHAVESYEGECWDESHLKQLRSYVISQEAQIGRLKELLAIEVQHSNSMHQLVLKLIAQGRTYARAQLDEAQALLGKPTV